MLRIVVIGALAGLIGSLVVIGVFRLLGMPASPALIGAIAGAVAASAVVGSIRRDTAGPAPDATEQHRG